MKNNKACIFLIITGALLFNSLFWNEQLGINVLLFDAFIISSIFFLYDTARKDNTVKYVLLAHIICLCAVIIYNSLLSKIACAVTLLLLIAFAEYAHRSLWLAGGSLLVGFTHFIGGFSRLLHSSPKKQQRKKYLARYIRFAIFPLLMAVCFFIIYNCANSVFAGITGSIGAKAIAAFNDFFGLFSFGRLLFLLFGFYLVGALLLRSRYTRYEETETHAADNLVRLRKKRMDISKNLFYDITVGVMGKLANGAMALKNEYRTGLISLVLLNLLLLVVNLIDVNYLWMHFTYTPAVDLFTMIHEGTDLLIFSIVLAMLVLLIFFRGNLNFYKENKWLKAGACIWLLQNAVLVFSVLLRDYYYIREFGLAYKRIGVLFFLLLALAGLTTVFLKVQYAKTTYYLLRVNAWCAVVLLVTGSTVQWDVFIAKYNIAHRQTAPLNLTYLLTLSDKVLPVLIEDLAILKEREKELNRQQPDPGRCSDCIESVVSERRDRYLKEQQEYSWLSWNYNDALEKDYLVRKPRPLTAER